MGDSHQARRDSGHIAITISRHDGAGERHEDGKSSASQG